MHKEIETLRKRTGRQDGPAAWDWDQVSATMQSVGADPALVPDDLKTYLCEGLFAEPLNLTLSLYSRGDLERFISKDEFFAIAFEAGYFIIGDRDMDFVSVRLADLVTYLIPGWSITEGVFAKEKRYKDLRSFLKRIAKDLKDEQEMAAEEAEERRLAIATLDPDDPNSMDEQKGRTRLILAIEGHDLDAVRAELKRGADPNLGKRQSPLHYATDERSVEAIDLLIEHGADPNGTPEFAKPPLEIAARRGRFELVQALVEHGAEVGAGTLVAAVPRRDPKLIDYLIEHGADPNVGHKGKPAFDSTRLYPDMLELFLQRGADPNNLTGEGVRLLAGGGAKRQLALLLDAGFKAKGSEYARYAKFDDPDTARILLEAGADPDAVDNIGVTWMEQCLNIAMYESKKKRVAMLATMRVFLEYNADPNRKDRSGTPPLVKAADEGWFEGFELLLECGADPNSTDDKGKTALDHVDNFRPKKNAAAARKRLAGS